MGNMKIYFLVFALFAGACVQSRRKKDKIPSLYVACYNQGFDGVCRSFSDELRVRCARGLECAVRVGNVFYKQIVAFKPPDGTGCGDHMNCAEGLCRAANGRPPKVFGPDVYETCLGTVPPKYRKTAKPRMHPITP